MNDNISVLFLILYKEGYNLDNFIDVVRSHRNKLHNEDDVDDLIVKIYTKIPDDIAELNYKRKYIFALYSIQEAVKLYPSQTITIKDLFDISKQKLTDVEDNDGWIFAEEINEHELDKPITVADNIISMKDGNPQMKPFEVINFIVDTTTSSKESVKSTYYRLKRTGKI